MGRPDRRKKRRHGVAAHAQAASSQGSTDALGTAAVAATFSSAALEDDEEPATEGQSLSRGQRKRLKRRAAFMRKMGIVSRIDAQDQATTRSADAFDDFHALATSLCQATDETFQRTSSKAKKPKLSGRRRQKLAVRELGHLKAVQTHASFQHDPFAAIQAHLQHTVVVENQALIEKTKARKPSAVQATEMVME